MTRDQVKYAKQDPDLFLGAAARCSDRNGGQRRRRDLEQPGGPAHRYITLYGHKPTATFSWIVVL